MGKDFFDQEYEKTTEQQQQRERETQANMDSWYSRPAPSASTVNRKPLYIVLICLALVACIGLGWLLCAVVQSATTQPSDQAGEILNTVVQYLKDNYYQDIPEEKWMQAIELSGTALMQTAGDRFSQLMSPQTYYDFNNPTVTAVSGEVFGMSFVVQEGVGLYVSSLVEGTDAEGKLQVGDMVLKLTDMKTKQGVAPEVDGNRIDSFVFADYESSSITTVLNKTYSATFHVLRAEPSEPSGYRVVSCSLKRSVPTASNGGYQFVEYYFPSERGTDTNISAKTIASRNLSSVSSDVGYIRIKEFMDYTDSADENIRISASDEFGEVMQKFVEHKCKHLVLDLKGNPGGNVQYVTEIASMLITDAKLSESEKKQVTNDGRLLVTYLEIPKPTPMRQNHYLASSYDQYFGAPNEKCDIIVLTDSGSASASELLTGCLLDYRTAVQMGTKTYGKGIAQTWQELPFEGDVTDLRGNIISYPWAIYYTCASYYSPLGKNIHGVGYTPDSPYNNLTDYSDIWQKIDAYWA